MKFFINRFNEQFLKLHNRSCRCVEKIPADKLFWKPREVKYDFVQFSCGEYILRSAGKVEQSFGGITSRLWDDPFEWTLPEELSTTAKILEYLAEVETTRLKGFAYFASDEDLQRELPAPEKMRAIFDILLETITRAEHLQGRAFAVFQMFSDGKLPFPEQF